MESFASFLMQQIDALKNDLSAYILEESVSKMDKVEVDNLAIFDIPVANKRSIELHKIAAVYIDICSKSKLAIKTFYESLNAYRRYIVTNTRSAKIKIDQILKMKMFAKRHVLENSEIEPFAFY